MALALVLTAFAVLFLGLLSSLAALSSTRVPVLRTPRHLVPDLRAALALRPGQLVVDAGAADGSTLAALCAEPGVRGRGFELNGPVCLFGRLRLWLTGRAARVRLVWGDFHRAELEQADVVYAYLMPAAMSRLARKCQEEMRPGTRLASFLWQVPDWRPTRVVPLGSCHDPLYIYEIGAPLAAPETPDRPMDTGQKLDRPRG